LFCEQKFGEEDAIMGCIENYCPICCEGFNDILNDSKMSSCVKGCKEVQKASSDETIYRKVAIEPEYAKQSIFNYCERTEFFILDAINCRVPMCQLACHHTPELLQMDINDEVLGQCYADCFNLSDDSGAVALPGEIVPSSLPI